MRVSSTPFEIIQFYYFWLWEYQRRNEEYIIDFDDLVEFVKRRLKKTDINENYILWAVEGDAAKRIRKKKENKSKKERPSPISKDALYEEVDKKALTAIEKFAEDYNRKTGNIKSPKKGHTSEYILKCVLDNKNLFEDEIDFINEYYSDLSPTIYGAGIEVTKKPENNNKKITAEIDVSLPVESVVQAARFYYEFYQDYFPIGEHIDEDRKQKKVEAIVTGLSNLLSFFIDYYGLKDNFEVIDKPRAIGLWMWDYIKKNKLTGVYRRSILAVEGYKRYILKGEGRTDEEIEVLLQSKKPLGVAGLEVVDGTLKKYFRNTDKCIKDMKVLQIAAS
jgi:hypothetical protein